MASPKPAKNSSNSSSSRNIETRTSFVYIATSAIKNDENVAPNSVNSSSKASSSKPSSHRSKSRSRHSPSEAKVRTPASRSSLKDHSYQTVSSNPPTPFERTSSKHRISNSASAVDSTKYDSQTEEIIKTILCSTTSNQSTTFSSSQHTENSGHSTTFSLIGDLRHGIQLLDSLVESEKLNKATKKKLVKKIVKGLLKAKFSISDRSSSVTPSGTTTKSQMGIADKPMASPVKQKGRSPSSDRSMQWLKPMTKSEVDFEKRKRHRVTKESIKLDWIQEEIQQLLSLQSCVLKQQKAKHHPMNPLYANDSRDTEEYYCSVGGHIRSSSTSTYASTKDSSKATHNNLVRVKHTQLPTQDESSDSPVIIDRFVRNRTKLRTPEGDASDTLGTYARSKQNHFLKQYQSSQERLARDLVYAHPYGNQYVNPTKQTRTPTSVAATATSASSNTFLSSGSISIPDMASSSYPEKPPVLRSSIAIQTTDSLQRRRSLLPHVQTPPPPLPAPQPAISYTITFGPTRLGSAPILKTNQSPTTMQDHLARRKPTFLANANARREYISEMNRLRQQRNIQRQKLFVLFDDPNELLANLQLMQPRPLLSQRRMFTTRQLKEATRQRYDQLPEIRAREEAHKQLRVRNSQRVLRDVFSRGVQKRALRGRVNLSNSIVVTESDGTRS